MEDYDDISVSQSQTVHHSVTELHSASGLNDDVSPIFFHFLTAKSIKQTNFLL